MGGLGPLIDPDPPIETTVSPITGRVKEATMRKASGFMPWKSFARPLHTGKSNQRLSALQADQKPTLSNWSAVINCSQRVDAERANGKGVIAMACDPTPRLVKGQQPTAIPMAEFMRAAGIGGSK
jgi:hypothetical protein